MFGQGGLGASTSCGLVVTQAGREAQRTEVEVWGEPEAWNLDGQVLGVAAEG